MPKADAKFRSFGLIDVISKLSNTKTPHFKRKRLILYSYPVPRKLHTIPTHAAQLNVGGNKRYTLGIASGLSPPLPHNAPSDGTVELHGFEPDKNCTTRLNEKYSQFSNVHIYPWGLGKERHTAYFDNTTAASSLTVSSINRPGRSYDTIEVVPLDEVLSGQVDMIALDIEGDEVEALLGAERIIRENKPILAICVYDC